MLVMENATWMDPILNYLRDDRLPEDKVEAILLRLRVVWYLMYEICYIVKVFLILFLCCVTEPDIVYILKEVHEGICKNHFRGQALAQKILRQGYY